MYRPTAHREQIMGSSYTWHPGARGLRPRWPFTPPLLADELFSSWLARTALAHGCPPPSLTYAVWPRFRAWCRDLDRGPDQYQLRALAEVTGLSVQVLSASTLRPVAQSLLFPAESLPVGTWRWILVLGCRNRSHAGGLQCCPVCIGQPLPHYVIQDRLAWHTTCSLHGVQLIDHCHLCLAPLQPELLLPGSTLSQCHRCGKPLDSCRRALLSPSALAFQSFVDESLGRAVPFGQAELSFPEWMQVARVMIGFLQNTARSCSAEAARFFQAMDIDVSTLCPTSTGMPFEFLGPAERAGLLGNVWRIMCAGPDRFMDLAADASLPASSLALPAKGAPEVLTTMASVLKTHSRDTLDRKNREHPRKKREVLRMWLRLQRRMRRNGVE